MLRMMRAGRLLNRGKLTAQRNEPVMTRFVARQLSTEHWYDLTRAKNDLGYRPRVSICEGLVALRTALNQGLR